MKTYIFHDKALTFAQNTDRLPLFTASKAPISESIWECVFGERHVIARGPQLLQIDAEAYDALCFLSFKSREVGATFTATWREILVEMGRHVNAVARSALIESVKRLHRTIFDDLPTNFQNQDFVGLSNFEPQKLLPSVSISEDGLTWSIGERALYLANVRPSEDKTFAGQFGLQIREEARNLSGDSVAYLLHRQFSARIAATKTVSFKTTTLVQYAFGPSQGQSLKNRKGSIDKSIKKIKELRNWKINKKANGIYTVTRLEADPILKMRWIKHVGEASPAQVFQFNLTASTHSI